jgi:hypothetical protein
MRSENDREMNTIPPLPAVILHAQGRRLTARLAQELAAQGFAVASAFDVGSVAAEGLDVILAERDDIDPQGLSDDLRRYYPATRMVSIVTIGAVMIVQAFAGVPGATDLQRLRSLAAGIRGATGNAGTATAAA